VGDLDPSGHERSIVDHGTTRVNRTPRLDGMHAATASTTPPLSTCRDVGTCHRATTHAAIRRTCLLHRVALTAGCPSSGDVGRASGWLQVRRCSEIVCSRRGWPSAVAKTKAATPATPSPCGWRPSCWREAGRTNEAAQLPQYRLEPATRIANEWYQSSAYSSHLSRPYRPASRPFISHASARHNT
jgi:hypothetical protein